MLANIHVLHDFDPAPDRFPESAPLLAISHTTIPLGVVHMVQLIIAP